jgi:hypothetical protein
MHAREIRFAAAFDDEGRPSIDSDGGYCSPWVPKVLLGNMDMAIQSLGSGELNSSHPLPATGTSRGCEVGEEQVSITVG